MSYTWYTFSIFKDKFNSGKGDHLVQLQNQVGEVTGIMKQNVEKVLERGEKLDDLVDKTDDLQASVCLFYKTYVHDIQSSIHKILQSITPEKKKYEQTTANHE